MAREQQVPYSVVKDLLDMQAKHNEAQLQMLAVHLEKCAALFEKALNPPLQPIEASDPFVIQNPRMSEEEEDLRYSHQVGDITQQQLDDRLSKYFDNSYPE